MRLKHLLAFLPVGSVGLIVRNLSTSPSTLSNPLLQWNRITASRISIFYLVFSIINCIFQIFFQSQEFFINQHAADFLTHLTGIGNATFQGFFVLDSQLHLCTHVPSTISTKSCQVVWNGTIIGSAHADADTSPYTSSIIPVTTTSSDSTIPVPSSTTLVSSPATTTSTDRDHDHSDRRQVVSKSPHSKEIAIVGPDNKTSVVLEGFGRNGQNVTLDHKCLVALNWPLQTLRNTKREDFTFLAFQIWVLGMSLVALLNESIPHIIAALLTHLSATAWGGFQFYNIRMFHQGYTRLVTHGACGVDILPHYWKPSITAEAASLIFNVAALILSCFLSFRIVKLFGWQTFKRVGASRTINRIYKLVLILSTVIQLTLFFVVTTAAIWIDQLYNGAIALLTTQANSNLYQALLVLVLVLLIPWLSRHGWFAARLELRFPMMVFLSLSALYLFGLGLMFTSTTFRWTFVTWGFFGAITFVSGLLILVGLVVGIMCRMNSARVYLSIVSASMCLCGIFFLPTFLFQ
ncbi:hypothetical protein BGW80DRAFT_1161076 [Lactifluus volemus]|nr:hypothetical protein BGW80DRAFT_1161076 [Lactifluus volemus]